MVTTSYPRFPGDSVGTFMEPIAKGVAARGHVVHLVAPWHPLINRRRVEDGVHFHFFKYAPLRSLNVFGYAAAMKADVSLRVSAFAVAPLALLQSWRIARKIARRHHASLIHAHWVIPSGVTAAASAGARPLVISLHGSDVYIAERLLPARLAARRAFGRAAAITACSEDLAQRARALGADATRLSVIPYGVDTGRFRPDAESANQVRARLGVPPDAALLASAGRLVRKKGFEYLIDAVATMPSAIAAIAGDGSLRAALEARAAASGVSERVRFLGDRAQDDVAALFAAADVIVVPSVRDEAGNVDGLPNVVLEGLASGTPLVTTSAGGIGAVVEHERTGLIVPERDAGAIATAASRFISDSAFAERIGSAGRTLAQSQFGWDRTAAEFEEVYRRALAFKSMPR